MNISAQNFYVDPNMSLEEQIVFLRQNYINFKFNLFEVLREELGSRGIEIFKSVLRKDLLQGIDKHREKSFKEIAILAEIPYRIFGFQIKQGYARPNEFQYIIIDCPYYEESLRRGIDIDLCNIIEEIGIEEASKNFGEITTYTRMCHGDCICTFRIRNTLGR